MFEGSCLGSLHLSFSKGRQHCPLEWLLFSLHRAGGFVSHNAPGNPLGPCISANRWILTPFPSISRFCALVVAIRLPLHLSLGGNTSKCMEYRSFCVAQGVLGKASFNASRYGSATWDDGPSRVKFWQSEGRSFFERASFVEIRSLLRCVYSFNSSLKG